MVVFTLTVSNALEYHAYGSLEDREKRMNSVNTFHGSATKEHVGWRVEERQNDSRGGEKSSLKTEALSCCRENDRWLVYLIKVVQ